MFGWCHPVVFLRCGLLISNFVNNRIFVLFQQDSLEIVLVQKTCRQLLINYSSIYSSLAGAFHILLLQTKNILLEGTATVRSPCGLHPKARAVCCRVQSSINLGILSCWLYEPKISVSRSVAERNSNRRDTYVIFVREKSFADDKILVPTNTREQFPVLKYLSDPLTAGSSYHYPVVR